MKKSDVILFAGIAALGLAAFNAGIEYGKRMMEDELQDNEEYIEMLEEEVYRLRNDSIRNKIKKYRPRRLFKDEINF